MQIEIEEKDYVATKTDIANLKVDIANLKVDMANLEVRLIKEISKVQTGQKDQFKWFITILVALFSIMVGIMLYMITKIG